MPEIVYRNGNDLDLDRVIELYRASTLGERRPVEDRTCMQQMLRGANLVISAWDDGELVGIARSVTDFAFACYLSDLAVHTSWQRRGIGKELLRRTQAALGPNASVIVLAAPKAEDYYPGAGFRRHTSAWVLDPGTRVRP